MPSTRKNRRNRRSKRNKYSGCTALSKKQCRFPCKSVMNGKNRSQFKHCRTIFSEKKDYLDAATNRKIHTGLKRAETSDRTSQKLHKKASRSRIKEKKAKVVAENLEADAEKEDTKTKSILATVSESLFGAPSGAEEPAPSPVEEPAPSPAEESAPAPSEESAPAPSEESAPAPAEESAPAPSEEPVLAPSETASSEDEKKEGI